MDWGRDNRPTGYDLEQAGAVMVGFLFKEEPVTVEEDLWVDAVDWEACNLFYLLI